MSNVLTVFMCWLSAYTWGIAVLFFLVVHLIWKAHRKWVAELSGDTERATSDIGRILPDVSPSPLLARHTTTHPTGPAGHLARLDQQARHAAVVTAGPFTREFNARVEWETGQPPAGRGPAEADLPTRRVRRRPVAEWAQDELPIEIGA